MMHCWTTRLLSTLSTSATSYSRSSMIWLAKANRESQKHGFAESFRYDSNDRCLLDHILIVLC